MISDDQNTKTFVLQQEQTKRSQLLQWNVPSDSPTVDLKKLLEIVENPKNKQFMIYDAETDTYVSFDEICLEPFIVPKKFLQLKIIMIKYREYQGHSTENNSNYISEEDLKKERSRQRSIGEVVQLVHRWRDLHLTIENGKRLNLQEAAKIVGVSKKSLDDYYYQLRVGEKQEFDFNAHLSEKIGFLRAFIKNKQPQRKNKDRYSKHPKKLKIIEDLADKLNIKDVEPEMIEVQSPKLKKNDSIENQMSEAGLFWGSPYEEIGRQSLIDCQNDFFKGFKFQLAEPDDPFLLFNRRRSAFQDNSSSPNQFNIDL